MPGFCRLFYIVIVSALFHSAQGDNVLDATVSHTVLSAETTRADWAAFVRARIPALEVPTDAATWDAKAKSLRETMLRDVIYKGVPEAWYKGPVKVAWAGDIETSAGYRIRKLRYEAVPGMWIPALLYEPTESAAKVPGILSVNGHVGDPGKANEEEQVRRIVLAKRGVIALHPEWLSFGELKHADNQHNNLASLNVCGVSGMSIFYLAMKRGLDVLADYERVDAQRLSMTGLSGGGWQTIILSALDERVAVTVPNAGYSAIDERVEYPGDMGDLEQVPPDLLTVADFSHLTAMLAPRPALLIYNDKDECCFQAGHMAESVFDPVVPVYALYGASDVFRMYVNTDPGTHNYAKDNRLQLYAHLSTHFALGWDNTEPATEGEMKSFDELKVGLPDNNATMVTVAEPFLGGLPINPAPRDGGIELAEWQETATKRLREVIRLKESPAATSQQESKLAPVTLANGASIPVTVYTLRAGEWTVPAIVLGPIQPESRRTTILFGDKGKASLAEQAENALVETGGRVVLIDLLLQGECGVQPQQPYQTAMLIESTGERMLGVNVAQLGSVAAWARAAFGAPVAIQSKGWVSGVTALMYGGLHRKELAHLKTEDAPATLKDLITQRVSYSDYYALFCFGLLREFDVPDLALLCQGVDVSVNKSK